jgi:AraC-like DNA-binding protein
MLNHRTHHTHCKPSDRQRRALRALRLASRCAGRVPLAQLMAAANYSPSRLRVLARVLLGEAPAVRGRRLRLDKAACLLLASERTIARAAAVAGFRSKEAFHRAFRARYGCTPRDWVHRAPNGPTTPRAFGLGAALVRHFHAPEASPHG